MKTGKLVTSASLGKLQQVKIHKSNLNTLKPTVPSDADFLINDTHISKDLELKNSKGIYKNVYSVMLLISVLPELY